MASTNAETVYGAAAESVRHATHRRPAVVAWPFADHGNPGGRLPNTRRPALRFLHEQRHILFHGHEPLDTDATPTLEGEQWLLHHGYTQAEGVANLDKLPETGCLVTIGYPKRKGGLGGYARYVAICPADWRYGVSVGQVPEAPLPRSDKLLRWDNQQGVRVRK